MAHELEKVAVDIERPIGCISRTVFGLLFVVYGAIFGVIGWLVYSGILVDHALALTANQKDGLIVGLVVLMLSVIAAALTRGYFRTRLFNRIRGKR